jgi:hypothetical protein
VELVDWYISDFGGAAHSISLRIFLIGLGLKEKNFSTCRFSDGETPTVVSVARVGRDAHSDAFLLCCCLRICQMYFSVCLTTRRPTHPLLPARPQLDPHPRPDVRHSPDHRDDAHPLRDALHPDEPRPQVRL